MNKYHIFAINREDEDEKIQLTTKPVSEHKVQQYIAFMLMRGEWLDRGYFVKEEIIN